MFRSYSSQFTSAFTRNNLSMQRTHQIHEKREKSSQSSSTSKKQEKLISSQFHCAIATLLRSWMKPYTLGAEGSNLQNPVTKVPLETWISGIQKISRISDVNLFCALVYIRRLVMTKPWLPFCWLNAHRLYLVSVTIASKLLDDVTYKNKDWITIGGKFFPISEFNMMEQELMATLDFSLFIRSEEIDVVFKDLVEITKEESFLTKHMESLGFEITLMHNRHSKNGSNRDLLPQSIQTLHILNSPSPHHVSQEVIKTAPAPVPTVEDVNTNSSSFTMISSSSSAAALPITSTQTLTSQSISSVSSPSSALPSTSSTAVSSSSSSSSSSSLSISTTSITPDSITPTITTTTTITTSSHNSPLLLPSAASPVDCSVRSAKQTRQAAAPLMASSLMTSSLSSSLTSTPTYSDDSSQSFSSSLVSISSTYISCPNSDQSDISSLNCSNSHDYVPSSAPSLMHSVLNHQSSMCVSFASHPNFSMISSVYQQAKQDEINKIQERNCADGLYNASAAQQKLSLCSN